MKRLRLETTPARLAAAMAQWPRRRVADPVEACIMADDERKCGATPNDLVLCCRHSCLGACGVDHERIPSVL